MSKRPKTQAERDKWNAYMREYRAKQKGKEPATQKDPPARLAPTPRQLEILRTYADPEIGGSQKAVAEALGISQSAVHNQIQRLLTRLNVRTVGQAIYRVWVEDNNAAVREDKVP